VKNGKNGGLDIDVNGKVTHVKKADADRVVIRAKGGDDTVTVDAAVTRGIRIEGGEGKDKLTGGGGNDILIGGDGDDVIDGRGGNDVLHGNGGDDTLKGGDGRDIIMGHRGNDTLEGGEHQDYLDGGSGDDKLAGQGGNDTLIGGRGDDHVDGGAGDDVLAGSSGKDTLVAGAGKNTVYEEAGDAKVEAGASDKRVTVDMKDEPGKSIVVKGSEDFKDQIDSDLEALRSIPKGRQMLGQIDDTLARKNKGRKADDQLSVTITEGDKLQSSFGPGAAASFSGNTIKPGAGSSSTVTFDATQTKLYGQDNGWNWAPSSVSLGHELLHSLHSAAGTMLPVGEFSPQMGGGAHGVSATAENEERRTVGLAWNRYTADGEMTKKTADISGKEVTENGLREDLGLEKRTHY
jgi:Ca2+-binding RTX toxin-like protein